MLSDSDPSSSRLSACHAQTNDLGETFGLQHSAAPLPLLPLPFFHSIFSQLGRAIRRSCTPVGNSTPWSSSGGSQRIIATGRWNLGTPAMNRLRRRIVEQGSGAPRWFARRATQTVLRTDRLNPADLKTVGDPGLGVPESVIQLGGGIPERPTKTWCRPGPPGPGPHPLPRHRCLSSPPRGGLI